MPRTPGASRIGLRLAEVEGGVVASIDEASLDVLGDDPTLASRHCSWSLSSTPRAGEVGFKACQVTHGGQFLPQGLHEPGTVRLVKDRLRLGNRLQVL